MAKVQRLVGIDFGTSTSIVKVKRYEGDSPVGDSHASSSVTFGNGESDSKAVTAVRLNRDGAATCGEEALDQIPDSTICKEFKMGLEDPDREKRRQAMELTEDYFRYLYSWYDHQRSDLGAIDDEERTLVSYPVKWRPEAREHLLETARNAGFRNVSGMDEPTAALYATLCRKMSEINQQGLLRAGESGYMLLVDMGAGTTDLAVCRYRVKAGGPVIRVDQIENEIIATWPMDSGAATFGGREVDRILEEYIIDYLVNCGFPAGNAEQAVRGSGNSSTAAKRWKETTVSKALNDGKRVESCAFVTPFMMFLPQAKPFPAFGRREFEAMLGEKVENFKNLVAGCLTQVSQVEPELLARKLDLVILTGGHSSWYFVEELLNGAMPGLSLPQLELVQRERSRVIRLTNPQETVALGLVYSRLPFQVAAPEPKPKPESSASDEHVQPASADSAVKGKDAAAPKPGEWPTNAQLAMCAKEFIQSYDSRFIQGLTRGAMNTMREKLVVPSNDEVFLIHDDTWMCSGKNGFVFCTSGIICKSLMGEKTFTSWLSFVTGELLPLDEETTWNYTFRNSIGVVGQIAYWAYGSKDKYALLCQFLEALQSHMRTRFGLKAIPKQTALTDAGGVTSEQLAQSAKEFIRNYDQDVIRRLTRGNAEKIMAGLEIPSDSELYLYHDDTILEGGKEGFAITDRGFYCRRFSGGEAVPTDWLSFFVSSLEIDTKQDYILLRYDPLRDDHKPIGKFIWGRNNIDGQVLIAHLHAYLRELYI